MSDTGRSFFGRNPAPSNQGGNSSGPARDAWNQPIKEEPNPDRSAGGNGKGNGDDAGDGNNTGIDDSTIDNIWKEVKKENSAPAGGNDGQQQQQQVVEPDRKKQMADYLESVGLSPMTLTDQEKEDLKNGNFDNLLAKMNDRTIQSHLKALSGSKALIEDAIRKGVAEAITTTRSQEAGVRNVQAMENALPFTKDQVIGPIAQTIMQRFLTRGLSTEDAIKGVKKAFEHMNSKSGGNVTVNKNLSSNFRSAGDSDTGDGNWLDILRPGG